MIKQEDICENTKVGIECLQKIQNNIPSNNEIYNLSELFKVLGDSTRIKIIYTIYKKELCVHDIANVVNMSHSSVSHQLKNLKQARLVKSRKEGKEVYYTLNDEHIEKIFKLALEHIEEEIKNGRELL